MAQGRTITIQIARKFLGNLLNFVYPPQCVICDGLHESRDFYICNRCFSRLEKIEQPFCIECRSPMDFGESKCLKCGRAHPIAKVYALGSFDERMRPLIHALKYEGLIPIAGFFGRMIAENIKNAEPDFSADMIVPIPLHPARQRKRGFNQSLLIADQLGKELGIPVNNDLITRIRRTKDQTGLKRKARIENMKGAFALKNETDMNGRHILLVDDVTTSGATSLEAAHEIGRGQAGVISLAVAAAVITELES